MRDCCECDTAATGFVKDREFCYCLADYYYIMQASIRKTEMYC